MIVIAYCHLVLSSLQRNLYHSPQFLEVRNACCPHPDDEVLVLGINPLGGVAVGSPDELPLQVIWPTDILLGNINLLVVFEKREGVVEDSVGDGTAGTGDCIWIERKSCPAVGHS